MDKKVFINDSVGTVQFPDTMSDDEIVKAIRFDILKESPDTGDTQKSASPVAVSTPTPAPVIPSQPSSNDYVQQRIDQARIDHLDRRQQLKNNLLAVVDDVAQVKARPDYKTNGDAQAYVASQEAKLQGADEATAKENQSVLAEIAKEKDIQKQKDIRAKIPLLDGYEITASPMASTDPVAEQKAREDNAKRILQNYPQPSIAEDSPENAQKIANLQKFSTLAENTIAGISAPAKNIVDSITRSAKANIAMVNAKSPDEFKSALAESALGTASTVLGLFPEVYGWSVVSSAVSPSAEAIGNEIGGEKGKEVAQTLVHYGTTLPFGMKVLIGSIASKGGSGLVKDFLDKNTDLSEKTKGQIAEASGHALFFGSLGLADEAGTKVKNVVKEGLTVTNLEKNFSPEQVRDMYTKVTRGVATPDEEKFVREINDTFENKGEAIKQGVQAEGVKTYVKGTPKWLQNVLDDFDNSLAGKLTVGYDRNKPTTDFPQPLEPTATSGIAGEIASTSQEPIQPPSVKNDANVATAEQRAKDVIGKAPFTPDDLLSEMGYSAEQIKSYSGQEKKYIFDSYLNNKPLSNEKYKAVMDKNLTVPSTTTERNQTPEDNRNEAIQLLSHTLTTDEAKKVIVNLSNQQLEDFLNAKESGHQAVKDEMNKLQSVQNDKVALFTKEEQLRNIADEHGVKFNGLQYYGKNGSESMPLFTDPKTGSTFTVSKDETLPDAILRVRKRFEENPLSAEQAKPIEQPKVEKPKVVKVKEEPKVINLDKNKNEKRGRPKEFSQADENVSPIIYSGTRIKPAWELRSGKVQVTEEFRDPLLGKFLDYSGKPSAEVLAKKQNQRNEGNIDLVAQEWNVEHGTNYDGESFREALQKEIDTFQKQGGHWSVKDIDNVVEKLNGFMDNGDQKSYEEHLGAMSPVVRKRVVDKLQEQWKAQINENDIKSNPEINRIEQGRTEIRSATEASDIERILQEFDDERQSSLKDLSEEERINIAERSAIESKQYEPVLKSFEDKAEVLESKEKDAKSPGQRNDVSNEIDENLAEIDQEIADFKKKKRTFDLAPEAKPSHPFIQELYDHIYYDEKAVENKLSRKQISDAIESFATQRLSGQASGQKEIRQELMKALTGVEDVTRREAGLTDVIPLLQKYFEKVQPDQNIIDKLEEKKKGIEEQKAKAIGHDQIFIDTFNGLKEQADNKNLSNPISAEPIILGPEVGKKEVTMKYVPAEDTYTVSYKQIDNHVTHIKHYNTLNEVLHDYRNEVNKYYDDPNKVRSAEEKQKVIKEAEANLDNIVGIEPTPEEKALQKKKEDSGRLNPDVLLQEGEIVKPSYDDEIRYQKVKFYFNQMFRELGKNDKQFKDRITEKYGNKLDNFVKRFFAENEIQERPTVQYVNAGKLPIPPEYVTASQYNNAIDEHQLYAVNLMIHNERQGNKAFLLADGTGFGKTRIELAFADAMFKKTGRPALLVTQNKAIIENSIKREAAAIGVGQVEHQSDLFDKKGNRIVSMNKDHIEVVTYDDIKSKKYKVDQQYSAVIFDEAQNLKNADSKRAMMAENIKADHHVYATATPMDNPHNAEYFLSKITGIPENEIRRSMGYKVIFGEDQWHNPTRKIEYEQGKSYSSVQQSLLRMRDSAIENGAMVRREYPFYGMVQPMYMALDQFQLAEQEAIDSSYGNHPKSRMAAIGELSRWVEPLKVNRVFDAVTQDLKEGKQVIIVAEGISDTEIKKLGTTVQGFITQIGNKLKDAGIPHAKIYGGGSLIGDIDKFQSGELKVAIMTPKSGGAGVNLDDSQGKAPRKMYVVTTNYAGDVFEQVLGRVSRRNTKSPADIRLVQFTNATTDRNRQNIIQRKLATLHAMQSGIDPDKAIMDENEEKIRGVIRTSGDQLFQEGGAPKISTKKIKNIFDKFLKDDSFGTKEYGLHGLLADWNGVEIDKDDGKLYFNDTRSSTGYLNYSKTDFIKWLMSDEAKNMSNDAEYQSALSYARNIVTEETGGNQLFQTGESRTPIPMDEAVKPATTKREEVEQAVYAQLPEDQAKGAMFVLDAGALSAVQNGKAKSISDYYENTLSQVTRMNYDPNMVFGNMLQQAFDKGLFAVHNTDVIALEQALKENGIPAPSIAVLTSPEKFREFSSDIQFIFERKTVDPTVNKENKIFSGDIYSPRASEEKGTLQEIVDKVKKRFKQMPRGAEFGKESRRTIPIKTFATSEFKNINEVKETSRKLINIDTKLGKERWSQQQKSEDNFVSAIENAGIPSDELLSREAAIQLVEKQAFGIDDIRKIFESLDPHPDFKEEKLVKVQQAMFDLFNDLAPNYFEAKPLRVVGIEEIAGVIASPSSYEETKKIVKGTILEGKIYKGGGTPERLEVIRDLLKRNPKIMFQEDLSKELEEQYIREQEAKGNLNVREQINDQKNQRELAIRKADLAQKRQAKENQFNSLVRQESQFKREIELARSKNDLVGVKKGLSALKSVQQQMNRLYKELGKSTDDLFDDSPALFQIPGGNRTVQGATDFSDFAKTGKVALYLFENANFSTVVHEFMHIWRRTGVFNEEQIKSLNEWVGSTDWSNWTKSQEEKLARGWERYIYNGEAPTQWLRRMFQKMKKWMQEIYVMIQKGDPLDINLPASIRKIFDAIFEENPNRTKIFDAIDQREASIRQARREMKSSITDEIKLQRMYSTDEMVPVLNKFQELSKKLETANPFEANDIVEQLVPLRAKIDEMSDFLKSVSSLASKYKAHDKNGNMSNWFIGRFSLMTKLLGKAGGELVQRAFAGDLLSAKLMDVARPHQHEIDQTYKKYSAKPNADENIFARTKDKISLWYYGKPITSDQINISRAVINAIEEKRNAVWQIGDKAPSDIVVKNSDGTVNTEMTADAKKVFEETKTLLDKFRDILTERGHKTREAYFTSVAAFDIADQQMDQDIMRMRIEDENGKTVFAPMTETQVKLQKNVTAESNRLKPRNDVIINRDTYLPGVLNSYVRSVSRKLSYGQLVDYIKNDLSGDISTQLKKEKGLEPLLDIARDYALNSMHPEVAHGHLYNTLVTVRKNMFQAFLSYNLKATMDNGLQRNLSLLYVSKEADKLENKLWDMAQKGHKGISGNLVLAIEYSRNAMQNYMELTPANEGNMGKFRRAFEKHDPFKSQEITNWKRAEALGIIDSAMKDKRYKNLLKKNNSDELSAINEVLEDDIAFGKAVSNGTYVSVESQVGVTPSVRPVIFDNPISRVTWLMLRSFKFRQVELLGRSFKSIFMKNGTREEALRSIFAQGITPDAEPAEALQYFVKYEKALSQLIKQMKRESKDVRDGVTLQMMEKYYEHIQKQVSDLDEIIQQIHPINDSKRTTRIWSKYYALLAANSYAHKIFWYFVKGAIFGWLFYNPDDAKKKSMENAFAEAHTRVMLDLSPIPAYGMNPSNLTLTPLFPNIELFPYGQFNAREMTKGVVRYGMNSFIPYAGVVNRMADNRLSDAVTNVITPRKNGNKTPQEKLQERIARQRKALEKR